jgi:DNA-directed RNA polymerase subunit E'/Rpb7
MNKAISPYIVTRLHSTIVLKPEQMNEGLYNNLKYNLIAAYKNRCYKDYGCVMDIIEILSKEMGRIETEDLTASARFNITYSCILCRPLKGTYILCKIDNLTKAMILAKNGPIAIIIIPDKVNDNNFIIVNNNIKYKDKNSNMTQALAADDIIKVKILNMTFRNNADNISVIGYLDNIATTKEIKDFYDDQYVAIGESQAGPNIDQKIVSYEEYTKNENIA